MLRLFEVFSSDISVHNEVCINLCRFYAMVACFKLMLDCFFAVWFVVGNVWIFGSRSSAHDAPNLYRYVVLRLQFLIIHNLRCFIFCLLTFSGSV